MNFRIALFVAALALCACRKAPAPADAGLPAPEPQPQAQKQAVEAAAPPVEANPCGAVLSEDGGTPDEPGTFTGFARDGRRFAYSVYAEGAGGNVLTIIEPPKTLVRKILVDTPEAKKEAQNLLRDFSAARRAAELTVVMKGATPAVTRADGGIVFSASPFEGGANTTARVWGCNAEGTLAALEVSTQFESEYGAARAFILFDPRGAQK